MADNVDIASLLRKAKVAAVKLSQSDAVTWIDSELDGYDCSYDDLPDYRRTHGTLRAKSPYNGLVPIFISDTKTEELVTRAPMTEGVGTLAKLLQGQLNGGTLHYNMAAFHRDAILSLMEVRMEPLLLLSHSQIENILSRVTSLVLNWSLELEANGILGENMSFDRDEKRKANEVTRTIIAQNIGHIGAVGDEAKTEVSISSSGVQNIDQRKLADFLEQSRSATDLLPNNLKEDVLKKLNDLEITTTEVEKRSILTSLKSVLEGATGNVAAQGIIQLISAIL